MRNRLLGAVVLEQLMKTQDDPPFFLGRLKCPFYWAVIGHRAVRTNILMPLLGGIWLP